MTQGVKGTGPYGAKAKRGTKSGKSRAAPSTTQEAVDQIQSEPAPVLRTVTVNFGSSSSKYAYNTTDKSIDVGDLCVVISPYPGNDSRFQTAVGYPTIVKVTSVTETAESITKASKWIIQKIDLSSAIAAETRREEIRLLDAKIARATKAAMEKIQLDRLRELSPDLDALIQARNELS